MIWGDNGRFPQILSPERERYDIGVTTAVFPHIFSTKQQGTAVGFQPERGKYDLE